MCSFDYHLRRAKKRYEDDILWMVAYYYSAMKDLCNQYPVWDKEDMLGYLIACFWVDLIKFVIYDETCNMEKDPEENGEEYVCFESTEKVWRDQGSHSGR